MKVSFLGPVGTYSHQAAHTKFGDGGDIEYVEKDTIGDAFRSVKDGGDFAVIPQENSTFGHVVETYDLLRDESFAGSHVFIRGEITISIQHCLLVRQGVKLEEIDRVMSHEQALGQCSNFISTYLPHATVKKVNSTAYAARALVLQPPGDEESYARTAAIGSAFCKEVFEGLDILKEGIQNKAENYTRFYVLSSTLEGPISGFPLNPNRAVIRLLPRQTDIIGILSSLQLHATRLDRRPSISNTPFEDVYFIEVQKVSQGTTSWKEQLDEAVKRVGQGCNATVIGMW